MARKPVYYAYCLNRDAEGRSARGFVLATSLSQAKAKATARVKVERRRIAKSLGLTASQMPDLGRTYCVRVWADPDRATAPINSKHYVEKETS